MKQMFGIADVLALINYCGGDKTIKLPLSHFQMYRKEEEVEKWAQVQPF